MTHQNHVTSLRFTSKGQTHMLTLLEFSDVNGNPQVKTDLPGPLRIGDKIQLAFCLRRQTSGRSEVLEIYGQYKVETVEFDCSLPTNRQILSVVALGVTPHWRAVKKSPVWTRRLPPAVSPRTPILG